MAHYAILNMSNVVTKEISGKDEGDGDTNWELFYQEMYKIQFLAQCQSQIVQQYLI